MRERMVFTYQKPYLQKAEVELNPGRLLRTYLTGSILWDNPIYKIHTWPRAMYGFLGKSLSPV